MSLCFWPPHIYLGNSLRLVRGITNLLKYSRPECFWGIQWKLEALKSQSLYQSSDLQRQWIQNGYMYTLPNMIRQHQLTRTFFWIIFTALNWLDNLLRYYLKPLSQSIKRKSNASKLDKTRGSQEPVIAHLNQSCFQ